MKKTILYLTLSIAIPLIGQNPKYSKIDSIIITGIDQTFMSDFDSAMATFQKLVEMFPDHIMGYFYKAATLQSKMMDYETDLWEEEFYRLIEKAIQTGRKQIERGDADPWIYFYLGSSISYQGLYQAKSGSLLNGIINSRRGIKYLQKAVEKDSSLFDAYLGIGSYKYWSGRFYKYLKWLPWIKDERDEGINMIILSISKGKFSYWVGINTLAWIQYDRKQYYNALRLFKKGLTKYPGSRFFLWGVADCYFRLEKYQKASAWYFNLLSSIRRCKPKSMYNEIVCRLKIVISEFKLKNYEEALSQCNAILRLNIEDKIRKRAFKHLSKAKSYKKKCLEKLESHHKQ